MPSRLLLLCVVLSCFVSQVAGQSPAHFTRVENPRTEASSYRFTTDVNGDGQADLVGRTLDTVTVMLGTGSGTFTGPVSTPAKPYVEMLANADFDGNGLMDLVVGSTPPGTDGPNQIQVFLGNGDGTFRPGHVQLSPGTNLTSVATGDFDGDGRPDVAMAHSDGNILLLLNTGSSFTQGSIRAPRGVGKIASGDFNGDGRIDLAFEDRDSGAGLAVLLNLTSGWQPVPLESRVLFSTVHSILTVDLDGDGRTDILAPWEGCHTPCYALKIFYSNADGTFTAGGFGIDASQNRGISSQAAVGDFNGDGLMDLALGMNQSIQRQTRQLHLYLGTAKRSFNTTAPQILLESSTSFVSVVQGHFNGDNRKDLVATDSAFHHVFLNDTSIENDSCPYPESPGVNICSPSQGGTSGTAVRFLASGRAFTEPVHRIELWIDGQKRFQVFNDRMDVTLNVDPGAHRAEVVEVEANGTFRKAQRDFSVDTGGECPAPTTPGINVCAPAAGATVTSPVAIRAAGTGPGGMVHMKVYVDHGEAYSANAGQINTSLAMANGTRLVVVQGWDAQGTVYKVSRTINVQSGGDACPPSPQDASVNVCLPVNGATVASPVRILATANSSARTAHMKVYVDHKEAYARDGDRIDTALPMSAGSHLLVVQAWDFAGRVFNSSRTITVSGSTGECPPLAGDPTVNICTPTNGLRTLSPVHVSARASSTQVPYHMKVYVDHQVVHSVNSDRVEVDLSMAPGTHLIVVQAWDMAGRVFKAERTITVTCSYPTGPGINVCAPSNGATISGPVFFRAAAKSDSSAPITMMRIYVDNGHAYTTAGDRIDTSFLVTPGARRITFVAWDSTGKSYSNTVNITVQ